MADIREGIIIGSRYRIERLLGRGGMGSVWAARHIHLDAPVAIKLMDASYASSPEARMRFEREARASATLDSHHVARVYDYGVDSGTPYIVMEMLHGEDLGARLQRERILSLADTSIIVSQICRGL